MKGFYTISIFFCMLAYPTQSALAQWMQTDGPPGGQTWCISTSEAGIIFAGTTGGLYRSTNGGSDWVRTTLPFDRYLNVVTTADTKVFAVGTRLFYKSTDDGVTWKRVIPERGDPWSLVTDGHGHVFLSTSAGLFESIDAGNAWRLVDSLSGTRGIFFLSMAPNGSLFGAGFDNGVYRSLDSGQTWEQVQSGAHIYALHSSSNNTVYIGTNQGILRSMDNGTHWIQPTSVLGDDVVMSIHSAPDGLVFAATSVGLYSSTNQGDTWVLCTNGIPTVYVLAVHVDITGMVLAGTYGRGIFKSIDNGINWSANSGGLATSEVLNLISTSGGTIICYDGYAVYRSTDRGASWISTLVMSGMSSMIVNANDTVYIGSGNGMYSSDNDGVSWRNIGPAGIGIFPLGVTRNGVILANTSTGLHRSTNGGTAWSPIDSMNRLYINALAGNQQGILWAAAYNGVYRSDDDGNHWLPTTFIPGCPVFSIGITSDNSLLVGTYGGGPEGYYETLHRSTDNGFTWTKILDGRVTSFVQAQNGWVLNNRSRVQYSADNGATWYDYNFGIEAGVKCLVSAPDGYVYAGTNLGGVYRTNSPLTSAPMAYGDNLSRYRLNQNYPNPFNPVTNISFSLPFKSSVLLKVFDVLGRELSAIVQEELPAGTYTREWDATTLPSGVYFYRLQAGNYIETKKLILLR
jgi:photosystem II stability/assembly factor-like uncharacterized protein